MITRDEQLAALIDTLEAAIAYISHLCIEDEIAWHQTGLEVS